MMQRLEWWTYWDWRKQLVLTSSSWQMHSLRDTWWLCWFTNVTHQPSISQLGQQIMDGACLGPILSELRSKHIQDALLNSPLKEAQKTAKWLEGVLTACKQILAKKQPPVHSFERTTCGQEEDIMPPQENIFACTSYSYSDNLTRAVWRNTELLENLLLQLTPSRSGRLNLPEEWFGVHRGWRRLIVCWRCKEQGHIQWDCMSGKRLVSWAPRQPQNQ